MNRNFKAGSSFLPGDRVICINDDFSNAPLNFRILFRWPVMGCEYTIREMICGGEALYLVEVVNEVVRFPAPWNTTAEVAFLCSRFRKMLKMETEVQQEYEFELPEELR